MSLSEILQNILLKNGVTDAGMAIIHEVMNSQPARRTRSCAQQNSKAWRLPSEKMSMVIQAESTLEYAHALAWEFDPKCYMYFDQPPSIYLEYRNGDIRISGGEATLDYFVISEEFVGYYECKPFKHLENIASRRPDKYTFDEEKKIYTSPALERYLEGTGLSYKISSEKNISDVMTKNLEFLKGYFQADPDKKFCRGIEDIRLLLKQDKHITIHEALETIASDSLYYAIAQGKIYFPLEELLITDIESSSVFSDYDGYVEYSAKKEEVQSGFNVDELHPVIRKSKANQVKKASEELLQFTDYLDGRATKKDVCNILKISTRTFDRKLSLLNKCKNRESMLVALIQKSYKKGNKKPRIKAKTIYLMDKVINEDYLSVKNISRSEAFRRVVIACERARLVPPSLKTFFIYVDKISLEIGALKRKGQKSAYQHTAYASMGYDGGVSVTVNRYLQFCHIDHTLLDLETVDEDGKKLGKVWLTIVVDEYSGSILAWYISYQSPSYVSVMMAIRLMVKNYGVLPECIVVDGGKEFQGLGLESLAANYSITIKSREGQPRSGGAVERVFGTINSLLIHNLDGNTKNMKNVREVSRSHQPKKTASWTFSQLSVLLNNFFETYNAKSPKKGDSSPDDMVKISKRRDGQRLYLKQKYTPEFEFFTLPPIKRQKAKISRGNPIRCNGKNYWHVAFNAVSSKGEFVDVKWDPFDLTYVVVYLNELWIKCNISSRSMAHSGNILAKSESLRRESEINSSAKKEFYLSTSKLVSDMEAKKSVYDNRVLNNEQQDELNPATSSTASDFWSVDIPSSKVKGE